MNRMEGIETMEAARIKFTSAFVQEVAARVRELTAGAFELGRIGSHPEHGTSYADAHEDVVWYGPQGARQACAYYTAAAMAWLRESGIVPEAADGDFLLAVQAAYGRRSGTTRAELERYDQWETRGADRGRLKANDGTSCPSV